MDEVITALIALLNSGLEEDVYKQVYYGINHVPAKSEMPLVEVSPVSTEMANLGTNSMQNEYSIRITIKDYLKDHLTGDTDKAVLTQFKTMVQRMEKRDADGKPLSTTILGVLHDNRKISDKVHINNIGRIEYNEEELDGSYILGASVIITANRITLRS